MLENRLKVFRAMRDITQKELAEEIGVTRQTVIAIEKGDYNPSLELAFKLANFFDVNIEEIFTYNRREN